MPPPCARPGFKLSCEKFSARPLSSAPIPLSVFMCCVVLKIIAACFINRRIDRVKARP
jgi:hypothetical protein